MLDPLDEDALVRVLTEPKNSLVRQYKELLHLDNAELVFTNAALTDMAAKRPHTMEEFLEVSGVGEKKAAQYGAVFLKAIAAFEEALG